MEKEIKKDIAIKVDNVFFEYEDDNPVLKGISFEIPKGEYVCIIGHNGSGKSTLSKIMTGLQWPDQGNVLINGNEINDEYIDEVRSDLAIVFQNPDSQFVGSTVEDDIAFGLENKCIEQNKMRPIIEKYAKMVGMGDFLEKEPHLLSGGQKQRVAIASALAMQPKIVIFDESTSMLDPKGKNEVKQIMKKLAKQSNMTIISITHDMDELSDCDRIIALENGQVKYNDIPSEVLKHQNELKKMQLGVPFILELSRSLKSKGITETTSMEELVKQLCKKK